MIPVAVLLPSVSKGARGGGVPLRRAAKEPGIPATVTTATHTAIAVAVATATATARPRPRLWAPFQGAVGPLEGRRPPLFLKELDLERGHREFAAGSHPHYLEELRRVPRAG